jgi:hypothetical protein
MATDHITFAGSRELISDSPARQGSFVWDIAPVPADGGLPADHATITLLPD